MGVHLVVVIKGERMDLGWEVSEEEVELPHGLLVLELQMKMANILEDGETV